MDKDAIMKIQTRIFGQIDIDDNKIITLEKGMIGFPELTRFALIYDKEKKDKGFQISWLQSMDDGDIAFPVTDPFYVMKEYNPSVSEEILAPLGELTEENVYVLVTVTVPKKVEDFSVNLKAPIVINSDTNKGLQTITESDYPVKYKIYHLLREKNKKAGE